MKTGKLLPLSLNPAIDTTLYLRALTFGDDMEVEAEHSEAAGKGPNVSRVLASLGLSNKLILLLGAGNASRFLELLAQENISHVPVYNPGYIRENFALAIGEKVESRLLRKGFVVTDEAFANLRELLLREVEPGITVVAGGKLPEGVSPGRFVKLCHELRAAGADIALDTSSLSLEETLAACPCIIKPNWSELEDLAGERLQTIEDIETFAQQVRDGGVPQVLVSLGPDGLLYVGECGCYRVVVPTVPVKSTVGAGDTVLSYFLAQGEDKDIAERLRLAAAAGTASCMLAGTNPPRPEDVRKVLADTTVTRYAGAAP